MTKRENFHRMMRGEPYGHVPLDLPMTGPVQDELERRLGTRDAVAAFDLDLVHFYAHSPIDADRWREAYARLGIELPERSFMGDSGYVGRSADPALLGPAYHLSELFHPLACLETLEQIESLPWADLDDPAPVAHFPETVAEIHRQGRVATLMLECTVFEFAWYLRGMEGLFEDLITENGIGDWLLDRFMNRSIRYARAAALAGADLIRLGDDVGTQRGMMVSVPFWRQHLRPRLARVVQAAKSVPNPPWVQYHSDGDVREIVDDLIELGVDILNPVQPECMDLDEVAPRWMDRLAFSGMIGTQTTMPFGTVQDVRAAVAKCDRWRRAGARMIVAPTHVLEPDVPWANIVALADAVRAITP